MTRKLFLSLFILILFLNTIVFADDEIEEEIDLKEILQTSSDVTDEPSINSRSAVVIERSTGAVLYGKNENVKRPMASTTKIMTAIIVLENADLGKTVEVSKKAASTGGSRLGLSAGAKITIKDLLYGLMLCSGNDAAVALAEEIGESVEGFSYLMNKKASELNLENTHFVTPHGLDKQEHYTTAYELAELTDYALKIEEFAQIVKTKNYTITINGSQKQINNTNELLGFLDGVYGVKTGFTNGANRCLVTAVKRGNMDLICVVLGADTKKFRTTDSIKLIEYVFKNYEMINMEKIIKENVYNWIRDNEMIVIKGKKNILNVDISDILYKLYPIKKMEEENIFMEVDAKREVLAPVEKEQIIGKISVIYKNEKLFSVNLVAEENVEKKDVEDYYFEIIRNFWNILIFRYG